MSPVHAPDAAPVEKMLRRARWAIAHPGALVRLCFLRVRRRMFGAPDAGVGERLTTDAELRILRRYASRATLGIVEIGVLDGRTTMQIARVATVPIYGIDPLVGDSMDTSVVGNEERIRRNMSFYPDFHFVRAFSHGVVGSWTVPFSLLFLDGDHRYEAVRRDFDQWLPLLEPGGYVALHDSSPVTSIPRDRLGWPGPVRLLAEVREEGIVEVVETCDSLTMLRKPSA
jgi:hypothetical protein